MSVREAPDFGRSLPGNCRRNVQELANKNLTLLRQDPPHPSQRLQRVEPLWSARVGLDYHALARGRAEGLMWFWIGQYGECERLSKN